MAELQMEWSIPINEDGAVNLVGRAEGIELEIVASLTHEGDTMYLKGLHFTKNKGSRLRPKQMKSFGRDFLRQHGNKATRLVIEGAKRTTGANRGVAPPPMTITLDEPWRKSEY
jgi:hypothetical protein